MPTTKIKPSTATTTQQETFSLVPVTAQTQMYKAVAALHSHKNTATESGAEVAEIAACLAMEPHDVVVLACPALGARIVRKGLKLTKRADGRFVSATSAALPALINDSKAVALVCAGALQPDDDFSAAFSFVARHKLPVLFLVANALTPSRKQVLDLRTLPAELGIPVFRVDALDAIATFRVTTEALHHARHLRGPSVIEATLVGGKQKRQKGALELLQSHMERPDSNGH